MGRNWVEATNAFLILAVRARRWALDPRWRAFRRAAALEVLRRVPADAAEVPFLL